MIMGKATCHMHRAKVKGRKFFIISVLTDRSGIEGMMLEFIGSRWLIRGFL